MSDLLRALTRASDAVYEALNALSGRSWAFDMLVSLPMDNPLVKAGPVGACFAYAWFATGEPDAMQRRRRILIATLFSLLAVIVTTKTLSNETFQPRPFVLSQPAYVLEGSQLIRAEQLDYRPPLAGENRDRFERLEQGETIQNDLGSFPSDHAGFYVAMALGIFLACRAAGQIALGWTLFVILLSRIVTGMHSPLDIVAGAGLGVVALLAGQLVFGRWLRRFTGWIAELSFRYQGLFAALLFLVLFEATSTLVNTQDLLEFAKDMAGGMRERWA